MPPVESNSPTQSAASTGQKSQAIDRSNVSALIPAYFEERHIADVARRVRAQVDDVLVVDDGSTDRTETEAQGAGVRVIRHSVNQGKGAAIKTGCAT